MINLISRDNHFGLTRDINILRNLLPESRIVPVNNTIKPPQADINVFIEIFNPRYLEAAPLNYIIPNQEWFLDEWRQYIGDFDLILCKTKYACQKFSGGTVKYISFTSDDQFLPIKKSPKFLHAPGKSKTKGTEMVKKMYERYPLLPKLTLISEFVTPRKFRIIQNQHRVHLCPSVAEGFGHYIVEAMSAKCVPIVLDGAPMNEIVSSERGFLVPVKESAAFNMGENHFPDEVDLLNTILEAHYCTDISHKGEAARQWFLDNDRMFKNYVKEVFK